MPHPLDIFAISDFPVGIGGFNFWILFELLKGHPCSWFVCEDKSLPKTTPEVMPIMILDSGGGIMSLDL